MVEGFICKFRRDGVILSKQSTFRPGLYKTSPGVTKKVILRIPVVKLYYYNLKRTILKTMYSNEYFFIRGIIILTE